MREGDYRPSAPAAGWYVDPGGKGGLRWWDGIRWTDDVEDAPSAGRVPPAPPSAGGLGDLPDGRRATRATPNRLHRIVAIALTGAVIGVGIWTGAGRNIFGLNSPDKGTSITTTAAAATPDNSSPASVTLNVGAGQTTTFEPTNDMHDQETIHIVATGLTPRGEYGAFECKSDSDADADCVDGIQLGTADASGTLRIDYTAQKGPFAAHKVTCVIPESCEVVVAPTEGNNYQQVIEILLDFA